MSGQAHERVNEVLSSWKEIASYLNRGVRTVQRWESMLGMPVHRPAKKSRSAVLAFRSELEQWLKNDTVAGEVNRSATRDDPPPPRITLSDLQRSVERCESLRSEMRINLREFNQALQQYGDTVRSLRFSSPRPRRQAAV